MKLPVTVPLLEMVHACVLTGVPEIEHVEVLVQVPPNVPLTPTVLPLPPTAGISDMKLVGTPLTTKVA
jgi:hypothetical protein